MGVPRKKNGEKSGESPRLAEFGADAARSFADHRSHDGRGRHGREPATEPFALGNPKVVRGAY